MDHQGSFEITACGCNYPEFSRLYRYTSISGVNTTIDCRQTEPHPKLPPPISSFEVPHLASNPTLPSLGCLALMATWGWGLLYFYLFPQMPGILGVRPSNYGVRSAILLFWSLGCLFYYHQAQQVFTFGDTGSWVLRGIRWRKAQA